MALPLVSIIIPVYNAEPYLASTLESVQSQEYRPIELLVVDDGSTDGSGDIARGFPEVRYMYQENQGAAAARNTGIENAKGDLIAFLDADDSWLPNKLDLQVHYLLEHPEAGFVLTHQRVLLDQGVEKPSWLKAELLSNDSVGYIPSTLLCRRAVFATIGGFDSTFALAEDAEWFFRARDAGVLMGIIPEVMLHKRVHSRNLSHGTAVSQPRLLQAIRASVERKRKREA